MNLKLFIGWIVKRIKIANIILHKGEKLFAIIILMGSSNESNYNENQIIEHFMKMTALLLMVKFIKMKECKNLSIN